MVLVQTCFILPHMCTVTCVAVALFMSCCSCDLLSTALICIVLLNLIHFMLQLDIVSSDFGLMLVVLVVDSSCLYCIVVLVHKLPFVYCHVHLCSSLHFVSVLLCGFGLECMLATCSVHLLAVGLYCIHVIFEHSCIILVEL